jgi:UDP-N-acetylmuramoylalanine--D-glutamate ligase
MIAGQSSTGQRRELSKPLQGGRLENAAQLSSFAGRRITIMGLGTHGGGAAAARYCTQKGATVTITDSAEAHALSDSLHALSDVKIARFVLGRHQEDCFRDVDLLVVNPAVRPGNRFVELARSCGVAITSEAELFLNACPAKVIAVTGTVGKSTTAAMLAAIFRAAGRRTWLGGNIGNSLLAELPRMSAHDIVIFELSSFQLHWLREETRWPLAAIVTNCLPNHIEWHGTWEHYRASKRRLIANLPKGGFFVIGSDGKEFDTGQAISRTCGRRIQKWSIDKIPALAVPGEHNLVNAACAAAAAAECGIDEATICHALSHFKGLPHRLQLVGEFGGRRFYNDSKSTSPAATIAALRSMNRPTWLLLGGVSGQADWTPLASEIVYRARGAALFGESAADLEKQLLRAYRSFPVARASVLAEAFTWCWERCASGEAILLSPACPSTDQFHDFVSRGQCFEELVHQLASAGLVTC